MLLVARSQLRRTASRAVALVCAGVAAGLIAAGLTVLLHAVQHLAFGYQSGLFEPAVEAVPGTRRVLVLLIAGVFAGAGWWALRHRSGEGPSVERVVRNGGRLAAGWTVPDGIAQIVVVGLGASLGREGAPRALSAVAGQWLAARARLDPATTRLVVACAAGAGLAGVYNVPVAGALFTLEVLLRTARLTVVLPALATSVVATFVARLAVVSGPVYPVRFAAPTLALTVGAVLIGPVVGLAGIGVRLLTDWARHHRPQPGLTLLGSSVVTFGLVGLIAVPYPSVLGNGRGPATLAFLGDEPIATLFVLAALKPVVTALCLRGGANGGLITPVLASGALLGGGLGTAWSIAWPGSPAGVYAVLGAAGMLAMTLRAPLVAGVLTIELTGAPPSMWLQVALAVATASVLRLHGSGRPGSGVFGSGVFGSGLFGSGRSVHWRGRLVGIARRRCAARPPLSRSQSTISSSRVCTGEQSS